MKSIQNSKVGPGSYQEDTDEMLRELLDTPKAGKLTVKEIANMLPPCVKETKSPAFASNVKREVKLPPINEGVFE